jgi:hypothetical protein
MTYLAEFPEQNSTLAADEKENGLFKNVVVHFGAPLL